MALQSHVSLMTVTDKEALFCIAPLHKDLYDTRKHPFFLHAQYSYAKFLLIMPISSLIHLAKNVGDPTEKVIWLHHLGRCGSTATAQVFNALPDFFMISGPMCLFSLDQTFKYKYFGNFDYNWEDSKEYRLLYKSSVRLLLKPNGKQNKVTVVKASAMTMKTDLKLLSAIFPHFIHIFLYRQAKSQVQSIFKAVGNTMAERDLTLAIASNRFTSRLLPKVKPLVLMNYICTDRNHVKWVFNEENTRKRSRLIPFLYHWCETCHHFKVLVKELHQSTTILAFRFEDFQASPINFFYNMLTAIGHDVSDDLLNRIEFALQNDSQSGSHVSRTQVANNPKASVTPEFVKEANRYLNYFGLPNWGNEIVLPNTVDCFKLSHCTTKAFE